MRANVSLFYHKFVNGSPAQSLENWCDSDFLIHSKFLKKIVIHEDSHLFSLQASLGKLIMAFNNYTTHTPRFDDATPGLLPPAFVKQQRHLFFFKVLCSEFFFSLLVFKILFRAKAFIKGPFKLTTAGQGAPPVEAMTL